MTPSAKAIHDDLLKLDDWNAIVAGHKIVPLQPEEYTVKRLMEETGRSKDHCQSVLAKLVDDGLATRRWTMVNGSRVYAYRLKK